MSDPDSVVAEPAGMSRERLASLVAAGGGLALLLGSLLPWASGPDADELVHGVSELDGIAVLGSRLGLVGGDARVTLLAGLVAMTVAGWLLTGRGRLRPRLAWAASGLLALAWSSVALTGVGEVPGLDGAVLDLDPGVGLLLAVLGALALLGAAAAWPPDSWAGVLRMGLRADRAARRGDLVRIVEIEQRLLARGLRLRGWSEPILVAHALLLARAYVDLGHLERARHLTDVAMGEARARLPEDGEALALLEEDAAQVAAACG